MTVEIADLLLLCIAAFCAGFVDAIVGGGGLIQLPAALVILPQFPVASVIGSLKIPSFSGTVFAAWQYSKKIVFNEVLLATICVLAFIASYSCSYLLTHVSNGFMKPVILAVLTLVAIYTFRKKDFGQGRAVSLPLKQLLPRAILISLVIGFYDGFIGPGAGSFFILAFIALLHWDFLQASAYAKLINLATNLGSVALFLLKGKIIWLIALPMAGANALGGFLGAKLAIANGNQFIRRFFLFIVLLILLRFCWDVFVKK